MTHLEISIPTDNHGFCLLQCPLCTRFFKLTPTDIEAEDVVQIWCPNCGLKSDNYLTEDVIELALAMTKNVMMDEIFKSFKKLERKTKNLSFKVHKKPAPEHENPIIAGIELLDIHKYSCCKKEAKIKPIIKLIGCYCPFCGVNDDGNH